MSVRTVDNQTRDANIVNFIIVSNKNWILFPNPNTKMRDISIIPKFNFFGTSKIRTQFILIRGKDLYFTSFKYVHNTVKK